MQDRNGTEIRTGDIVEVTGGFFKHDNGRFLVKHTPGDDGWFGRYHSLTRLNKNGTLSKAKYRLSSWPLTPMTNSWVRRREAREHNAKFAKIEVVGHMG